MKLHIPPSSHIGRIVLVLAVVCLLAVSASVIFVRAQNTDNNLPANTAAPTRARVAESFGRLPLSFELNKGQIDKQVKFLSHGPGYDLFLTSTEAVLRVQKPTALQAEKSKDPEVREGTVLRLKMLGANATPEVEGQEELPGKIHYFIGNDPTQWRRNIPTYKKAYFKGIYPGIDVVYYGTQRELEYDFVIGPGANPKLIRFSVEGADKIRLDKSGKLLLSLKHGEVSLNKAVIYQLDENGSRREVNGTYVINGNEVRFKLERFDSGKALIIDPVLSYSTLLGSNNSEAANGIAVDSQGSAYVTGTTEFSGFPTTPGAFRTVSPRGGAFVTKLDPTGSSLVYSTYLSGIDNNSTRGSGIAVDAAGNAYVTGISEGNSFPLVNPLKTNSIFFTTSDAAANWNNLNSGLVGDIQSLAVAPTAPNTIYAPTSDGFYRSTDGGAIWSKTPSQGSSSPSFTGANAIAVDPTNSSTVYVAFFNSLMKTTDGGNTWTGVNTSPVGFFNIFTIVIDPVTPSTMYVGAGNGVFKSTDSGANWIAQNNFGVATTPSVRTLAIDPTAPLTLYAGTSGNGLFKSTNGGAVWTAMNTGMTGPGATNVGTIAIDPANPQTIYTSTSLIGTIFKSTNGAASWDPLTNGLPSAGVGPIVVNSSGVFASVAESGVFKSTNGGTNWTTANNGLWNSAVRFLVAHPANASVLYAGTNSNFSGDAFVTKLNASGSGLLFSTVLGGNNGESADGIAVDANGNVAIVGSTDSLNFPTVNAVQASAGADNRNAYVTKLNPGVPSIVFSTYLRGNGVDNALGVAIDSSSNVYVTGLTNSSDFLTANAFQSTYSGGFNGDAFVTKLTGDGALTYSTYLGGNGTDTGRGIAADASGNAYVTGVTDSANFPTQNPIQPSLGGSSNGDVFVTKLSSNGSALVYSTYLGGSGSDIGQGIAIDSANNAYITGYSDSIDFPLLPGALRTKSTMFKSTDAAASWSNDNYGLAASTINAMVIDPTQPSIVYVGTATGVFKTTNGGRTWTAINNGLTNRFVTAMVMDPSAPDTLYIAITGFQTITGVYKSTDGGANWIRRSNGIFHNDLTSLAIVPSAPNTLYLGVTPCCSPGSHIYKTTDGADNWALIPDAPPVVPFSIVVDPLNNSTIYAGDATFPNGAVYKSTNSGTSWDKLPLVVNSPVRWVALSLHTAGLVYATADQGLFRSTDGGANWTQVPSRFGKIYFDPVSPSTLYLIPANFANFSVFKSTDNGQTWTTANKGLGGGVPTALVIDPVRPSNLYLGTTFSGISEALVVKVNAAGNSLVYSTFIGNGLSGVASSSQANGIAVDASGNAYVAGNASSGFAVTPNAFQPFLRGSNDAFISKLSNSYIISGRVLNSGDVPLSGAEVVLNDGTSLTTVFTESDGSYQFSRLREGGNYTVSASKPQFTMTPSSQTFNNLNSDKVQDFAALQSDSPFYTISGQVTENGVGLPNVTVTLSGSQVGLRTTDGNGNYSFELIAGGNYIVTPSILGFNFAPASTNFNGLGGNQIANFAATRQNFVVTNANNHGAGSLREAMLNANATPGKDTITFNIPGPGVKTINVLAPLPDITDTVVIDGTTQPGYAGTPLIEINGAMSTSSDGLVIKAGGTTVRGLSIGSFGNNAISLNGCDNNVIQGNYLGVAADGTTARGAARGIQLTNSSNNLIGGTSAAVRNVISGNSFNQIDIVASNANVIQGNFLGTNAAGTARLLGGGSIATFGGITIFNSTSIDNLIGGSAPGAGNLISGHAGPAISTSAPGTVIQGNLIGTDVNGVNKIPNQSGISASGSNILIGGATAGAKNVISGNSQEGITISGTGSRVQGNYIGTDITGNLALGNSNNGVVAGNGVVIGGTNPGERNIIAGNSFSNISLSVFGFASPVTVQGNYIGTDVTGTHALGATNVGVSISSNNNLIGGLVAGARNVISGNVTGVQIGFSGVVGNVIQGNFIGLNAAGTAPLGNTLQGVAINGSVNNLVGGTQAEAANRISFNGGPGVVITGSGQGNAVRGNSIFSNTGLGIDLGGNGVTPNDDGDSDTGANNLQNFPVITGVLSSSNSTTIQGTLKSLPNTTFQLDFFSNAAVDPSGNGEGATFFGTMSVDTNANGDATINAIIPAGLPAGRVITATATDPNGNTSEFSAADATSAAGSVQFTASSMLVIEDVETLSITVVRTGGSTGSVSVDYSTANGSAIAGQDYTSTSGTLTFAGGETIKTIQIPITNDSTTETDETFTVSLNNNSNLEVVGGPSTLVVTLQDRNTTPVITINSVAVQEGNTGTTTDAMFIINLSAATGRTVSVNFATVNQTATGGNKCGLSGIDYESASGNLAFSPTITAFAIPIKVCGDNNAEANETFRIAFSNPVGAAIQVNSGFGTIFDDDPLDLLLEESGPVPGQAAALDALLAVRDPFRVQGIPDFWPNVVDKNTRVAFFVRNLQLNPGETSSSVFVRFINGFSVVASVAAEDVRPIPNSEFTQVVVRLPNNLLPNTYTIQIVAHSRLSNTGTILIIP